MHIARQRVSSRHRTWRAGLWLTLLGAATTARAAVAADPDTDWPMYQHDIARSGVTTGELNTPLLPHWSFRPPGQPVPSWAPPQPVPVEGVLEVPRVRFDDAYHVAVVDGVVYFGSSADHKVYALDLATGRMRWSRIMGGPVRLAPTVQDGRVFVACDDGRLYCLRARDGSVVWRFQAAPSDERVLGRGQMISLWPVRGGVLVDNGVVYLSAGVFPHERVLVYAVRADNGAPVWTNDTLSDRRAGQDNFSPQGYMLATADWVCVPSGRALPAAFDRNTGRLLFQPGGAGRNVGGTYALLAGKHLYAGTSKVAGFHENGRAGFAWFPGRRLIITRDVSYLATDRYILALDRRRYPIASRKKKDLETKRERLVGQSYAILRTKRRPLDKTIKDTRAALESLAARLTAWRGQGKKGTAAFAKLQAQRDTCAKTLESLGRQRQAADNELADVKARIKAINAKRKQATAELRTCTKWRCVEACPHAMILAGRTLVAGGQGHVAAVDADTGELLWRASVDGKARGLAVADGRLIVSTDTGHVICFGEGIPRSAPQRTCPVVPAPFAADKLTRVYESAAETIVKTSGVTRGYGLVLGCGTGRLAYELAKRTSLRIYGVESDPAKVAEARRRLDAAGLYGTRVCIDRGRADRLPYPDYFANLIVSDATTVSGRPWGTWGEVWRVLKPQGGVVCIGQPAGAAGTVKAIEPGTLKAWFGTGAVKRVRLDTANGCWATRVRGPLPGAADWTHQYADPANTACSADRHVRCPLGVLWFGDPGPDKVVNRHRGAAAPLCVKGRVFLQGTDLIMAFDAYNGLPLWERELAGAYRVGMVRECSNLAADQHSLFVGAREKCHRLDAATGKTRAVYDLPPSKDGSHRKWGYVAVANGTLYGSTMCGAGVSDCVFAVDLATGKRRWTHYGKKIQHLTMCLGGRRLYLADDRATPAETKPFLADKQARLKNLTGIEAVTLQREIQETDIRIAVALDAATGRPCWQQPVDLTDCGGRVLTGMYHRDGLVVFVGAHWNGHYWPQFYRGDFSKRRAVVLSAKDGKLVWQKRLGYRIRPLIVGHVLYAEPWAFDVRTGKQLTRDHPITGQPSAWEFGRPGHHCGAISACPSALFFRSWSIGYYDLAKDDGTRHFGGQRPGCWINILPTAGLVVIPEASSGCVCLHAIHCTVVLGPRRRNTTWGLYDAPGKVHPVRHMAVNLGAPGDRRDDQGALWLSFPRPPSNKLLTRFDLTAQCFSKGGPFQNNHEAPEWTGADKPWLFASGYRNLRHCNVRLLGAKDSGAAYTVRLAFADPDNAKPGVRVFDVKLQGKTVLKGFDIAQEAGARCRGIVKEFRAVAVTDKLRMDFVPRVPNPTPRQGPVLTGIAVTRE